MSSQENFLSEFLSSVEFLFHGNEIQDAGTNEGGDMSLSSNTAPAPSDVDAVPVLGIRNKQLKKVPAPPCLERGPEAGVNRVKKIFMDRGRTQGSCKFLQ